VNNPGESFQVIYDLLDVRLIERGIFYNPLLSAVKEDLDRLGLLVKMLSKVRFPGLLIGGFLPQLFKKI